MKDNYIHQLDVAKVDRIYSQRAKHYEFLHHLYSRYRDTIWRQEAAWLANAKSGYRVLDICAGTCLSAVEYIKIWDYSGLENIHITALDYNEEMLAVGKRKISRLRLM